MLSGTTNHINSALTERRKKPDLKQIETEISSAVSQYENGHFDEAISSYNKVISQLELFPKEPYAPLNSYCQVGKLECEFLKYERNNNDWIDLEETQDKLLALEKKINNYDSLSLTIGSGKVTLINLQKDVHALLGKIYAKRKKSCTNNGISTPELTEPTLKRRKIIAITSPAPSTQPLLSSTLPEIESLIIAADKLNKPKTLSQAISKYLVIIFKLRLPLFNSEPYSSFKLYCSTRLFECKFKRYLAGELELNLFNLKKVVEDLHKEINKHSSRVFKLGNIETNLNDLQNDLNKLAIKINKEITQLAKQEQKDQKDFEIKLKNEDNVDTESDSDIPLVGFNSLSDPTPPVRIRR